MVLTHTRDTRASRREEERFHSLIAASAQVVWTTDARGNVIEDIPTWRAFTGQTEKEIKGQGWINALHPDDQASTAAVWAQAVKTRSYYATEYRVRRHDGEYCHFLVRGVPILKEDGSIREWVGTCTNITEWKHVQEELFNSRQMLQLVLDTIPQRVFWKDRRSVYMGCNKPFAHDAADSAPDAIVGKTDYELGGVATTDAKRQRADDLLVMESGASKLNYEEPLSRPDGSQHWLMSSKAPLRDQSGEVIGVLGTYEDITVRKRAEDVLRREQTVRLQVEIFHRELVEESLRERRRELHEAQRLARVGSWIWDLESEKVIWSEEMYSIFGLSPALPAPGYPEVQRFFAPESWQRLDAAVKSALESGTPYQLDLEIVRQDGQQACITALGEGHRDPTGRIVRLRGSVQDITGRKRAEEELQRRTAFFETLVHGSFDGILVVDSMGKKILQNQRTADLWELPPSIVNDPDDDKQVEFVVKQRVKFPTEFFTKVSHLYSKPQAVSRDEVELKSGTVLDRYSSPVVDKAGKYYGRIWSFRDITERKRAEQALKKAHDTLEQRVHERTLELKIANRNLGRINRILRILSECNQLVVHAKSEGELLRKICQIIVGPGGYPAVWIGFAEEDEAKTVRPVAQEGFEAGHLDSLKITWADAPLGRGPMGSAIRSGAPSIVTDTQTSADFAPWREDAARRGYASAIGLPLRGHGRIFGALTICARTVDAFPPSEVGVLTELADDLAYGIMSLRGREERKKAESELRRLADLQSAILNNTNYTVISTDEKGIITSINPAGERALGYTADECVGRLIPTVFHDPGEMAERARTFSGELGITIEPGFEVFVARARLDLPNEYEWTYVRKDGSRFPVLLSVTALRDAQRNVIGFLGLANDITARKRAEQELHRSEQKFATIFHGSPVALSVSEYETGRLVEINEAMLRLAQTTSRDQLIGRTSLDFGFALEERRKMLVELQRFGHVDRYEIKARRLNGEPFVAEVSVSPYELDGKKYLLSNVVDITERYRAREEIQRLNKDLEKRVVERTAELVAANQELETFNYSVSHDLRSPLRAVDAFSHLLQDDYSSRLDSDARDYLERITTSTARMDQLITGLLNLTRIGRASIRSCQVDLSGMAAGVVAELRESAPQREVQVTIGPNLRVNGDPDLLRSVLQNLIGNAWKYTSKQPSAHIEFGAEETGGETVFHVRDDGAGFNPENVGKLFKAFQRLHGVQEFPGTGIGLTIVQRIIQRHGGRIWAEGMKEKGATFYFTIPRRNDS
jgi:PAS domain S-box-containing protein